MAAEERCPTCGGPRPTFLGIPIKLDPSLPEHVFFITNEETGHRVIADARAAGWAAREARR